MPDVLQLLKRSSRQRRNRPLRRITQKTGTSCGVACVAMLARISFQKAFKVGLELWGVDYWSGTHRTDIQELRMMLAALGLRLGRKVKCRDWSKVPMGSLVAVQRNVKKNTWHWVVADADNHGTFALDPRASVKKDKRRDFEKIPVAWYHHVRPIGD